MGLLGFRGNSIRFGWTMFQIGSIGGGAGGLKGYKRPPNPTGRVTLRLQP